MGVKELNPFLREHSPEAITETLLKDFSGKKIAIDTSIYFYKFLYKNDRFLEGFFQQIYRLRVNNMIPIYIFDGIPPPEKNKTLQQRRERKDDIKNNIKELEVIKTDCEDSEEKMKCSVEISRLQKKLVRVTSENIQDLKNMLTMMNIQFIQSVGEADLVCGKLCKDGIVDMVLSDDMDLLTSGARIVLRNFFIGTSKIMCYDLDKILHKLNFTNDQWIDFCILCGCDYCDRIHGLGTKNSLKLITAHGDVPTILNIIKEKYNIPADYLEKYNKAKTIFNNNTIELDFEYNAIKHPGFIGVDNIINLLKERTNLTERQILNRVGVIYQ
jgi:flap endonuclease-1